MYKTKIVLVLFSIFILVSPITVFPVLADETTLTQIYYRFPWGNGIDDNHDGVIDDWSESDVFNGTQNISANGNVILETWANDSSFIYPSGGIPRGVTIGGCFEEPMIINSSKNHSVSPIQSCKYLNLTWDGDMAFSNKSTVLNVIMFYVNISALQIMNGASQLWYRSPLAWDNSTYQGTQHYLNIYDDEDNLVYASTDYDAHLGSGFYNRIPDPKILVDNSGNYTDSEIINMTSHGLPTIYKKIGSNNYFNRSYFQLNMNFQTGVKYRFEEYIKTIGNASLSNFTLFMCPNQDIAGDNETKTYIFYNTPYSREIPIECSWGFIATIGKGRAGSELLLQSSPSYTGLNKPTIITHRFSGSQSVDNTKAIEIILPLRTSIPLNITVTYRMWSGASTSAWLPAFIGTNALKNVTGTLVLWVNITDIDTHAPNDYQFMFQLDNFDTVGDAMTFSIYPSLDNDETETCFINYGLFNETEVHYFGMDIQLREELVDVDTDNYSSSMVEFLIGAALILGAILLLFTVIGIPVAVTFISTTGLTIGEFAITAGIVGLSATLGTLLIVHSFTGQGLENFMSWLHDAEIRVLNTIYSGIVRFFQAIWDVGVWLVESLKYIGSELLKWGSIVLNAILQIIWFVAFMIVLMVWGAFLTSMKYIAKGDFDSALSSFFKPIKKPLVYFERKSYAAVKGQTKIQKWSRKVKSQSQK